MYSDGGTPAVPDAISDEPALRGGPHSQTDDEKALHNVWDEPSLRASGVLAPSEAMTYSRWYEQRRAETSSGRCWATVALLTLCGGPFAILGAFVSSFGQGNAAGLLMVILVAPPLEEMLKIGATLIVLENKPFLFQNRVQVVVAAIAGAMLFAVVENLLYIYVYYPEGNEAFRLWRWSVCTALHVGCTTVAAMGLLHMWHHASHRVKTGPLEEFQRPRPVHAYPYIMLAAILHATYNALATVMEISGGPF